MLELSNQSDNIENNSTGEEIIVNQEEETPQEKKAAKLRAPRRLVSVREELRQIKSIEETGRRKQFVFARYVLIITSTCLTGLGIYILIKHDDYLGEEYNFDYSKTLLVFLCMYTSGLIGIFLISYILGIFINICFGCCYFKTEPTKKENVNQFDVEQNSNEAGIDRKDTKLLANVVVEADRIRILPYAMSVFIVLTITLYFIALPFSCFIFYALITDQTYENYTKFWPIYASCLLSFLNGLIILIVLIVMVCMQRKTNDILKKNMDLDENHITELRNEVRSALKNAK